MSTSTPPASRRRTRWRHGVLREGAPAAQRYLAFLKAGGSLYPLDALKLAGIDMTTPEPVERAFGVLEGLVDRLDKLVGAGPLAPAGRPGGSAARPFVVFWSASWILLTRPSLSVAARGAAGPGRPRFPLPNTEAVLG